MRALLEAITPLLQYLGGMALFFLSVGAIGKWIESWEPTPPESASDDE